MLSSDQVDAMRATVEDTFTDSCVIEDIGESTFDPNTGTYSTPADEPVYEGSCAVAPTFGDRVVIVGADVVTLRTYLVRLPWTAAAVAVDHVITVTSADPHLDGRQLRVRDIQGRSEVLERVVIAEDNLG